MVWTIHIVPNPCFSINETAKNVNGITPSRPKVGNLA